MHMHIVFKRSGLINPIRDGGGVQGKMSINHFKSYFLGSKGNDFLILGVTSPLELYLAKFFHWGIPINNK